MSLKILLLSHRFAPFLGGIETVSEILANAFFNEGHEVHLLTWQEGKEQDQFPFKVIRKPNVKDLFREHAWADIVFENNPCLRLSWPGIFYNKPLIVVIQTWISRLDGKIGWQDRIKLYWWLKRASGVVAISNAIREGCWPNATIIGNPYNNSMFRTIPNIKKTLDFVFLGRLVSDKGADIAIRAFHKLKISGHINNNNAKYSSLTIIGDGPEMQKLQLLVKELDLSDCISFLGPLHGEKLVECLNQHRFMLIPSVWEEPFGVVALEGIACGCIPIASNGGGLPDAVGNAGIIFQRGSSDALYGALCSVLNGDTLEQQLRKASDAHLKSYSPDVISKKYLKVIEEVVSR